MTEKRSTLVDLPSGKIELVFHVENGYSKLEFNADCISCLPFCHAMCCRLRQGFTVLLESDEIAKYKNRPFPRDPQLRVLDRSEDGESCVYLDADKSLCTIHGKHPKMCKSYHCSPGGVGENVKHRDGGWLWTPMGCLQQLGVRTVVDIPEISKVNRG